MRCTSSRRGSTSSGWTAPRPLGNGSSPSPRWALGTWGRRGGRGLRADIPPVPPPQSFVPPHAEELLSHDFERIGRLLYKGGLNLERAKEGWFALAGSTLYVCFEDSERHEALQLRKLQELCRCPVPPPWDPRSGWKGVLGGTDPVPSCCGVIQPGGSQQGARGGGLVGAAATSWELGDPLLGRVLPLAALPPLHPLPPCCSPSLGWSWAAPDGLLPSLRSHPGRQRGAGAGGEAEVNAELVAQPGWRVGGDQPPSSKISPPAQAHPAPGMPSPLGEPRLGSGTVLVGLGRGHLGPR